MKQNNFIIIEYSLIYCKDYDIYGIDQQKNLVVPKKVFEEIKNFILKNSEQAQFLVPKYKKGLGEVLQAQNYVGLIQTKDGTTIEILPKISGINDDEVDNTSEEENSKSILIKMLKTLRKSPFKHFNMADLKSSKMPLLEVFISMFLDELAKLIQKGIRSDYLNKEENLKFLKGKLKINEQVKYNYIHKERFFVAYQEFSSDRIENRLIKTTLKFLYKKSKSSRNQQRIREFLFVFDEISLSKNIKTDFSKVRLDRQMKDYELVLLWSKTFLLEKSFSPYQGNDLAFALLFDMNLLFESYVYDYLRRDNNRSKSITAQDKKHHLACLGDKDKKFLLKPDIVIDNGTIILDTKWKVLSEDKTHQGVNQADMYQLYAYGTKYMECENLYLIYPKREDIDGRCYTFFNEHNEKCQGYKNLNLKVEFFDLDNLESNKEWISQLYHIDKNRKNGESHDLK